MLVCCGDMNETPTESMKDNALPLRQTDAAISDHDLVAEKLLHPDAILTFMRTCRIIKPSTQECVLGAITK